MKGFYRIATAVPSLRVADINYNLTEIKQLIHQAISNESAMLIFPELSLCGYTCGDLFYQETLLKACQTALLELVEQSRASDMIIVVGCPIRYHNDLYNTAVIIQSGQIRGIVPKSYLPNYKEFYEKRWFRSGRDIVDSEILIGDFYVPFGVDLVFDVDEYFSLGIEICEDLWNVIPPSSYLCLAGATVIANLSASNELVAKAEYRRDLIANQSARCMAAYVYSSSGVGESTQDVLFGGHRLIAENGTIIIENERFEMTSAIDYADVDLMRLRSMRYMESSYQSNELIEYRHINLSAVNEPGELNRFVDPHPFVPGDPVKRATRCEEIFQIQSHALAKRMLHVGNKKLVIGISGGLDSTLALLVCVEAVKILGMTNDAIMTITMPGYGTSDRTYDNAVKLCKLLNTDFHEINIVDACEQHFKDINHDPAIHDVTYENVQARERTKILMNLANKHFGIVVGTGDLSEMALGWSTYNGDHMSMYAVNCSVPKTLIRYLVDYVADTHSTATDVLKDILDTPISPELLPTDKEGDISQQTEKLVGPYELHDFFLYHHLKYGARPDRIIQLANIAFDNYDKETITQWLTVFYKRFFSQQFKRSCTPDGPKVGTISLSPRGDWRMPSDALAQAWLAELEGE